LAVWRGIAAAAALPKIVAHALRGSYAFLQALFARLTRSTRPYMIVAGRRDIGVSDNAVALRNNQGLSTRRQEK
jgi:hypothetical protein